MYMPKPNLHKLLIIHINIPAGSINIDSKTENYTFG